MLHEGRVEEERVSEVQAQVQEGSCTLLELAADWLELPLENERGKAILLIFWFRSKMTTISRFGQLYYKVLESNGTELFHFLLCELFNYHVQENNCWNTQLCWWWLRILYSKSLRCYSRMTKEHGLVNWIHEVHSQMKIIFLENPTLIFSVFDIICRSGQFTPMRWCLGICGQGARNLSAEMGHS